MARAVGVAKAKENRLREMAKRRGLVLHKSPRRDPGARDYDRWWVHDGYADAQLYPTGPGAEWGAPLDHIERWLAEYRPAEEE